MSHPVGDYTVDAVLGDGGFSTVYAAHHNTTGHQVALKVLHRRWCLVPQIVARFLREAEVVRQIENPNIVALYEVGWIDGDRPYLVMERLDGTSLGKILSQRGSLTIRETLDYFEPICNGLAAAHRSGIVHRDLKPSNVMVSHPGQPFWLKLIDFGIAKLVASDGPRLTRTGSQVGTMTAMSPEQLQGLPVDWRADIYSLGVLLYQCVTGQRPFIGSSVTLEQMHLHAPAPRASRIAPVGSAIDRVIVRCMQKDPDRRYLSVDTFLIDLRSAVQEAGADAPFSIVPGGPGSDSAGLAVPITVPVIGLYAEVLVDGQPANLDALDDDMLDEIEDVIELVVARTQAEGHVVAMRTGTSAMACRVLGEDTGDQVTMDRMMSAARALAGEIRDRAGGSGRIELAMYLELGEALRSRAGDAQTLSGPFIETRPWLASPPVPGTWMSRTLVETVLNLSCETAWCRLHDD
ncbi:MAG TPA: serine/threonine-protein kinase [Kofleriaceae bacterium]|nr:serine/threonine-protein kinase [Kofleriaceae bacterium]